MKKLPNTKDTPVVRTDFSDDAAWESICSAIRRPVGEFRAFIDCISDPAYEGLNVQQLVSLVPSDFGHNVLFVVDRTALTHPESPVLVVDLGRERGRTFRVVPREMWGVENNLSISNMDFYEFADNVDPDGIFRDFPGA